MIINPSEIKLTSTQIMEHCMMSCKAKRALFPYIPTKIKSDIFKSSILKPNFERINKPISSTKEYLAILNKLKKCLKNSGFDFVYFNHFNNKEYQNIDVFE